MISGEEVMDKITSIFSKKEKKRRDRSIAFFVDGPNIIRKEMNVDLADVRKKVAEYGDIKVCKVFLDQYASEKLIEAMVNQGYTPVITTGDVDVMMAVEATEQIFNPKIDTIAIMTRDIDFRPVLVKAKEMGKETILVGVEQGFSAALKNTADILIIAKTR
ncbi:MAG: TIGR00288 family NYN domain-containing protein [Candidatus Micrarchaeia archaeon]